MPAFKFKIALDISAAECAHEKRDPILFRLAHVMWRPACSVPLARRPR
jgi:hypothetical protein